MRLPLHEAISRDKAVELITAPSGEQLRGYYVVVGTQELWPMCPSLDQEEKLKAEKLAKKMGNSGNNFIIALDGYRLKSVPSDPSYDLKFYLFKF